MRALTLSASFRPVVRRAWVAFLLLLASVATAGASLEGEGLQQWRWTTEERVVAVGDVHGAYEPLVGLLTELGLISAGGRWSGGRAHLVMLGDLVDRGPRSRDVMDLVMRLQGEAVEAGGRVHMVLGNHEVMNLVGDLRYLAEADWAAFAGEEKPKERERYIARRIGLVAASNGTVNERRAILVEAFAPGFFARARGFAPEGRYGAWLLKQPILVVVNDVAFVHGGLPEVLLQVEPGRVNEVARGELEAFLDAQARLRELGVIGLEMSFREQLERARSLVLQTGSSRSKAAGVARAMLEATEGLTMGAAGPLWYRGTSLKPADDEGQTVSAVLDHLGARRVVVGHTPTHTGRIVTRLDATVVRADTGMLASHYNGRASAVVLDGGRLYSCYPGEALAPLAPRWELAVGSFSGADEAEEFLSSATIVSVEEVGAGSTRPLRVTLAENGRRGEAIFKSVETVVPCRAGGEASGCRDSFRHEVAAYRVDRVLGLDTVPPTVVREVDGQVGSLQLWVEGAVNENTRRDEGLQPPDPTDFAHQFRRVHLFDRLILNLGRNGSGVLITTSDWKLHLIDHSRAFEPTTLAGAPTVSGSDGVGDEFLGRLRSVRPSELRDELDELLTEPELDALLARLEALRTPPSSL